MEEVRVFAGLLKHAPPREDVIDGGYGIAVAPLTAVAEMEGPDFLVGAEIVMSCTGGNRLERFGLKIVKALTTCVRKADVLHVGHLVEIERVDVATIDEAE